MWATELFSLLDIATALNAAVLALCLAIVCYTGSASLRAFRSEISEKTAARLHICHGAVVMCLLAIWATTIVIVGAKTNFNVWSLSSVETLKLVALAVLTLGTIANGRSALPTITYFRGQVFDYAPLAAYVPPLMIYAATSAAWVVLLLLHAPSLQTASAAALFFPVALIIATMFLCAATYVIHAAMRNEDIDEVEEEEDDELYVAVATTPAVPELDSVRTHSKKPEGIEDGLFEEYQAMMERVRQRSHATNVVAAE